MDTQANQNNEQETLLLYKALINSWNNGNALDYANLFTAYGNVIGFDGSQMNGKKQIEDELNKIFANHKVATYVYIVREIHSLSSSVYLLRAVAGMIPPGKTEINPKVNAIQTMIAQKEADQFRIAIFQNTPAALHERPDLSKQLTEELQEAYEMQK
ncbi:MAG: SgcJ/EcaC family oxidoreductase [Ginsengibacter sp.]